MYDALVLAGGINSPRLRDYCRAPYEALIDIDGEPMVLHVVRALRACSQVGKIVIIGPQAELLSKQFPAGTEIVQSTPKITENIMIGLNHLQPSGKILIVASDIPMLTVEALDDFLSQCQDESVELFYPIVSKETNERLYPGVRRTYVKMREGTFTGGNIFLAESRVVPSAVKAAETLIENRKSPLVMCGILGWSFVLRFLLGWLSLPDVEKRVSKLLGLYGRAVISAYPEVGLDVDKPSDLELVRSNLRNTGPNREQTFLNS